MEDMHNRNTTNTNVRESLLEGVSTEEGGGIFVRSPLLTISSETGTGGCSIRGHKDCRYRMPKNTLTFLSQIIVVYGIISVSINHLSVQSPNQELWLILLSSAFGYILPSPGLKYLKPAQANTLQSTESPVRSNDIDAAPTEEDKTIGRV